MRRSADQCQWRARRTGAGLGTFDATPDVGDALARIESALVGLNGSALLGGEARDLVRGGGTGKEPVDERVVVG